MAYTGLTCSSHWALCVARATWMKVFTPWYYFLYRETVGVTTGLRTPWHLSHLSFLRDLTKDTTGYKHLNSIAVNNSSAKKQNSNVLTCPWSVVTVHAWHMWFGYVPSLCVYDTRAASRVSPVGTRTSSGPSSQVGGGGWTQIPATVLHGAARTSRRNPSSRCTSPT